MLHIKDIEAFARINEALAAGGAGRRDPLDRAFLGEDGQPGAVTAAMLLRRLMMTPTAHWPRAPQPVETAAAVTPESPAPESVASGSVAPEPMAAESLTIDPPAPEATPLDARIGDAAEAADAPAAEAPPVVSAQVLPFPVRPRDAAVAADGATGSVRGLGYDFDLVPRRPVTMVGLFNRFLFGRR